VNVEELCAWARTDADALEYARGIFIYESGRLFADRPARTTITGSDAGSCALALWATLHEQNDIPDTSFYARDRGTLLGAWYGSLLKAAMEKRGLGLVTLEAESAYLGVPGHVDAALYDNGQCVRVYDFKTTAAFKTPEPHELKKNGEGDLHYCFQVAGYALGLGAPEFSIVRLCGAGLVIQSDYDTPSWADSVAKEYARLRTAESDTPPPADPSRAYLCASCLYGACSQNMNPQKPAPDLAAMLTASVEALA
jgi:hypothetical protein